MLFAKGSFPIFVDHSTVTSGTWHSDVALDTLWNDLLADWSILRLSHYMHDQF